MPGMHKLTINGVNFFWEKGGKGVNKNALFLMYGDDDSVGDWVGYYQSGNTKEPIRYTEGVDEEKEPSKKPDIKVVEGKDDAGEGMATILIDGDKYYWDKDGDNGLWKYESGGVYGNWVGYYQPKNKKEPIRYTDKPE